MATCHRARKRRRGQKKKEEGKREAAMDANHRAKQIDEGHRERKLCQSSRKMRRRYWAKIDQPDARVIIQQKEIYCIQRQF